MGNKLTNKYRDVRASIGEIIYSYICRLRLVIFVLSSKEFPLPRILVNLHDTMKASDTNKAMLIILLILNRRAEIVVAVLK